MQLATQFSSLAGIEQLAERACAQMLQAYDDSNRSYPETDSVAPDTSAPSNDPYLNLERLLVSGTRSEEETRQLGVLALLGAAQHWPASADVVTELANKLFWLESETRLPALTLAVEVLDQPRKLELAEALLQLPTGPGGASRGQSCLALMWARALSGDPSIQEVLLGFPNRRGGLASRATPPAASVLGKQSIRGRVLASPRGPLATALSAFTGWMLIRHLGSGVSRYILAYRARAELNVSERGIEVHEQTTILGRKLRERTRLISLHAVRSLSREVRYARAGTYVGLAALALGSFIGMRLFVDGIRAPGFSGPTVLIGLLVVLSGLALDFALATWLNASRAQCRLLIETVGGRGVYLTCDEPAKVDGMLLALASRLTT